MKKSSKAGSAALKRMAKGTPAAEVRKPTPAEVKAADEFMARKASKKGPTPQVAAIPGTAPLGAAIIAANGKAKPKATKNGVDVAATKPSPVKVTKTTKEPKPQDDGPFFASKEAVKTGIDELPLKTGSARLLAMAALLKAPKGLDRAALEKIIPGQVSQAVRVLRIVGLVAP